MRSYVRPQCGEAGVAPMRNALHNVVVSHFLDLRFLWVVGAIMLVFCTVGFLAAGALAGLPLSLGAAALSIPQENVLKVLAYSSPVWAPIGIGMGTVATSALVKGMRRERPAQDNK